MSKEFYLGLGRTVRWPDFPGNFPPAGSITYDDVLLMPGSETEIISRKEPKIDITFGPWNLGVPIVSAPMDTVSGPEMIIKLAELGGVGTYPRNNNFEETLRWCEEFSERNIPCIYALGLHNPLEEAKQLKERGAQMILIDVAHGGMNMVARTAGEIKNKLGLWVMAGNIVTFKQAEKYKEIGVDVARVGVGPGGACTTRLMTGVGFPQLSAIFETSEAGIMVVADGGIKYPGDVAKALAGGAMSVMIGSMFAGTEETPGEVINGMKSFRGQASEDYMKDNGLSVDGFRAAEGVSVHIPVKGSVSHVINEITGGLRSAMSYVGARNLQELKDMAVFELVSASTKEENKPRMAG